MSAPVPAGKRPPEDTRWRPSRASVPHKKSPDRQRSGLAVTKEWRPGRRRATRPPTEERATHGAKGAVCGYVRLCPRRRRGAQALRDSTHTPQRCYGRWLLSKACQPPSPSGLQDSSFYLTSCVLDLEAPVTTVSGGRRRGEIPGCVPRSVKKVLRDCRAYHSLSSSHPQWAVGETLGPERPFRRLTRRGSEKRLS